MPRKNSRNGKRRATSTADKAYALAKKANRKELKYLSFSNASVVSLPIPSTGNIYEQTNVAGGTDNNDRIGNVIQATSIKMKATLTKHASASSSMLRVMFVKYNQDALTSVTDVLQTASYLSQKSIEHRYDSKVLFDRTYNVDTDNPKKSFNINLKTKFPIYFGGNLSSDLERNGIFMIVISDEPTNTPTLSWTSTFYFHE